MFCPAGIDVPPAQRKPASNNPVVPDKHAFRRCERRCRCCFLAPHDVSGLVTLEKLSPATAKKGLSLLEPGSALLAKWLPVFFVPTLVVLPLSPAPSGANALRLLLVVLGGWFTSLATTAAVVRMFSPPSARAGADKTPVPVTSKPAGAFGSVLVWTLGVGAAVSGLAAGILSAGTPSFGSSIAGGGAVKLAKWASLLMATLFGFSAGTKLPRSVNRVVHPVVTCTAVAMGAAAALGRACGLGFADMLRLYVTKSRWVLWMLPRRPASGVVARDVVLTPLS